MIIDAMDLLYSNRFYGFCLVSSDSNFTQLASRIQESGLVVYGCRERKTPQPFVTACNKFIYFENLRQTNNSALLLDRPSSDLVAATQVDMSLAIQSLRAAIEATSDEDGWATLANVGNLVTKRHPKFDPQSYSFAKLSDLIHREDSFETLRRIPGEGKPPVIYIQEKIHHKRPRHI